MKKRIISAAIMLAILIPTIIIGGILFSIVAGIIACLALKEIIEINDDYKIPSIMKIIGYMCMLLLIYSNVSIGLSTIFGISYETLSLVFLMILAPTVFLTKKHYGIKDAFYLCTCTVFLGLVFNLFISLFNESKIFFILVLLIACITDIFALFGGKLIGHHKLTKISPKKTIEGSICGTLVSVIVSCTYYLMFINEVLTIKMIIILIVLSIIGQIGDLFFSLIKRENGKKDFSNLIPGHGGILDRIDSIIFILIAFVFLKQFL